MSGTLKPLNKRGMRWPQPLKIKAWVADFHLSVRDVTCPRRKKKNKARDVTFFEDKFENLKENANVSNNMYTPMLCNSADRTVLVTDEAEPQPSTSGNGALSKVVSGEPLPLF
ncbi:hypothetical protein ACJJTC_009098 [Scirpophaga incertulas]